jgi:selenocysteine lyase/cysteine desulfurase
MNCQKHLFALDPEVHYLNGAAYSPGLRSGLEKAQKALELKAVTPFKIRPDDHFLTADRIRAQFCQLLNADPDPERVALIPAVSYGLGVVAANLHRLPDIARKSHILLIGAEFPNNVYGFERCCETLSLHTKTVNGPTDAAQNWNQLILENINPETALVVMPQVHWVDGTHFDLEKIGQRCREMGALLALDLTQSLGVLPFHQEKVQADAVICAAYKWLLGAYGTGLAWFGPFFDNGVPLEESWMNRVESHVFSGLTRYLREYRPKAQRYNVGEFSQFALLPILEDALRQILEWTPEAMQAYCQQLTADPVQQLRKLGCTIAPDEQRAAHLFSVGLPPGTDNQQLAQKLAENRVFVSVRGAGLRVSTNVYNTQEDWEKLIQIC